jgi:hypothetical protein
MNNEQTGFLTPKQQKFCDEYLIDLNATRAALRAGYSASTALSGALMRIPKIAAYLQQRKETASREAQITHQMVLAELGKIAFSNMANYYHQDGTMKGVHELTADEAAALWCLKATEGENGQSTFIRLNNKLSALEKIARHLGFYHIEEAEEPEREYVIIDKDELTDDDLFEDDSFDEEEEESLESEVGSSESEEVGDEEVRDTRPKLNEATLQEWRRQSKLPPHIRASRYEDPEVYEARFRTDSCELLVAGCQLAAGESCELSVASCGLEEKVVETELTGGVIEFGVRKQEEPKKPSGRCEVPLMMGNSKEYRSW